MYVVITKQLPSFQNCFGVLSRSCQGDRAKTFSHFNYFRGQRGVASTMLPATCLAGLFDSILKSDRQVTFKESYLSKCYGGPLK